MAIPVFQTVHGPRQISPQPIDLTRIVDFRSDLTDQLIQFPAGDALGIGAMKSDRCRGCVYGRDPNPVPFCSVRQDSTGEPFSGRVFPRRPSRRQDAASSASTSGSSAPPGRQQVYDSENFVFAFSIMATAFWIRSFFFRPVAAGLGKLQIHQHILQGHLVVQQVDLPVGVLELLFQPLAMVVRRKGRSSRRLVGHTVQQGVQVPAAPTCKRSCARRPSGRRPDGR
jgi:hypothetical protein